MLPLISSCQRCQSQRRWMHAGQGARANSQHKGSTVVMSLCETHSGDAGHGMVHCTDGHAMRFASHAAPDTRGDTSLRRAVNPAAATPAEALLGRGRHTARRTSPARRESGCALPRGDASFLAGAGFWKGCFALVQLLRVSPLGGVEEGVVWKERLLLPLGSSAAFSWLPRSVPPLAAPIAMDFGPRPEL